MVIIIAASSGVQRNAIEIAVRCYAMGVAAVVDSKHRPSWLWNPDWATGCLIWLAICAYRRTWVRANGSSSFKWVLEFRPGTFGYCLLGLAVHGQVSAVSLNAVNGVKCMAYILIFFSRAASWVPGEWTQPASQAALGFLDCMLSFFLPWSTIWPPLTHSTPKGDFERKVPE